MEPAFLLFGFVINAYGREILIVVKFNRELIATINGNQSEEVSKVVAGNKKVAVPEQEIFQYIYDNARKGNEMAAVLLDEWQRSCKPKDDKEELIVRTIQKAANKIFK